MHVHTVLLLGGDVLKNALHRPNVLWVLQPLRDILLLTLQREQSLLWSIVNETPTAGRFCDVRFTLFEMDAF